MFAYFFFCVVGFVIALFILILRMQEITKNAAKILAWIFRFCLPSFCLSYGLMGVSNRQIFAILDGDYAPKSHYTMGLVGADMLIFSLFIFQRMMLGITGSLCFIGIFIAERLLIN